ncbi:MAG TPA: hypothetical protein V6C65_08305 [Allocoleopsis sp.]
MKIRFTKHWGKQDWMECIRDNGTSTYCPMPKQGILPHDFVHYVVEDTLNLRRGFYGILAMGVGFPRSAPPWDAAEFEVGDLTEALQAESLVECFQSEMWNSFEASENFGEILQIPCSQRNVPTPVNVIEDNLQTVRSRLQTYTEKWNTLETGETLEVVFRT